MMSIVLDKRTIIHKAIDMPEASGKPIILERQHRLDHAVVDRPGADLECRLERAHPPPHR